MKCYWHQTLSHYLQTLFCLFVFPMEVISLGIDLSLRTCLLCRLRDGPYSCCSKLSPCKSIPRRIKHWGRDVEGLVLQAISPHVESLSDPATLVRLYIHPHMPRENSISRLCAGRHMFRVSALVPTLPGGKACSFSSYFWALWSS